MSLISFTFFVIVLRIVEAAFRLVWSAAATFNSKLAIEASADKDWVVG